MDTDWLSLLAHPSLLVFAYVAFIGAAMGSFLTLVTYRLPRDEKIGLSRSRCPNCSTTLRVPDLVPIISWVASRGRCRHCKTKVHFRYPLTELACAAGGVLAVAHYGMTLEALAIAGLWWGIVAIIVTDLEHYIILDEVQVALAVLGILHGYATHAPWENMLIAALAGGVIGLALKYGFIYLRHKDGLGLGDVKFLCVAGLWLANGANFVPFLFFSGIFGIVSAFAWRAAGQGARFPFGPALALALLLCVVYPPAANNFWQLYGLLLSGSSG
jgi:leader peptidase (prepilin peptidase)/N-methyltransferase